MRTAAVLLAWTALLAAGCGGEERAEPGPRDAERVAAATGGIVEQCGAARAGFVAEPDGRALDRDVDALLGLLERVRGDAPLRVGPAGLERTTTLREQAGLASRRLAEGCAPEHAARLREALEKGGT